MKLLKIVLIIALLIVMCSASSLGIGTITSGDNKVTFEKAEPNSLNEWFYNLSLSEKIELYNYWKEVDHE